MFSLITYKEVYCFLSPDTLFYDTDLLLFLYFCTVVKNDSNTSKYE